MACGCCCSIKVRKYGWILLAVGTEEEVAKKKKELLDI